MGMEEYYIGLALWSVDEYVYLLWSVDGYVHLQRLGCIETLKRVKI